MSEKLRPCYFGNKHSSECHKSSLSYGKKYLKPVKALSSVNLELLKRRFGNPFNDDAEICSYHEAVLLTKFEFLQKKCCNPFAKTSHIVYKGLYVINIATSEHLQKLTGQIFKPGQKLCAGCRKDFADRKAREFENITESYSDIDVDDSEAYIRANESLIALGESPLKLQKVSKRDSAGYLKHKREKAAQRITDTINVATGLHTVVQHQRDVICKKCNDLDILVNELKAKLKISSHKQKIQILTLAPNSWTIGQTAKEFDVSIRMVKRARKLKMEEGILATPHNKEGRRLHSEVRQRVLDFYEDDEYSRLCPGKKDYVSIRINDEKVHKQKRLLLCNLREMFTAYCTQYGNEVGFTKFCELRPKWCVTVGAAGMHSVCVCLIHQNVKLMVAATSMKNDYKELIGQAVCNIESKDCMLQRCEQCPGRSALETYLLHQLENYDPEEYIQYKQWVHTDRDTLQTHHTTIEDFTEELLSKIVSLTSHHYITKHQSTYLKRLKESLKDNEIIILMDFAENYSFLVQDSVQGFHWDNSQATLHPFVIYYGGKKLQCLSVCMISDCLRHDTVAVHVFIMELIIWLKNKITGIEHIHYFSDGSTAQYKNFKNFMNLCFHEEDFGITAQWNFFGTGHGKSPCDGIGGTTKRLTAFASLQRPVHNQILTPKDVFKFCSENVQGIHFSYIPKEQIENIRPSQEERFSRGHTIAGTRESHHFIPISKGKIRVSRVSNDAASFIANVFHNAKALPFVSLSNMQPGIYVACMYENAWWIGNVCDISTEHQDALISFMHPHGPSSSYHWPAVKDKCWIPEDHIIKVLEIPSITSTGRKYFYPKSVSDGIEKQFKSTYST